MSTSLARTLRNIKLSGWKRYAKQMNSIGDAKAGTLVGIDDHGNHFYETHLDKEIHLRTRWVEYAETNQRWDVSQVEPGWHYWLAYGSDTPPNKLQGEEKTERAYPVPKVHAQNYTGTTGAYVPYNTAKPKFQPWETKVSERTG
ncbi:NADH dehydrogenase [ubiquinone] 1 alpha subcomplex subunit [Wickerhamomyces ciferrii]|uniref:NADH dehydrogenase [ubiquinone] 1 alpha subcomplex subunit n=1 Tax=Wickerhamomyces ciferrii (strain ATCC 14091 / BCRC 22168 / CBS 111 / JCM 3599 / NBRC 0793 / NRRL Y-1031 F-60-10) TaxID=1206466 RepID=K0KJ15_WICCF|nr:NADH dehydrogenase [ubiquinone] 1 alpha subcomplex subunit [Wickerhamomyces ciferrii]CCH45220.1 NADH dehydrogenase [ubiquinone] 1 alpha subcomplex subunit [Wickerhamomyces ciferrii]